MLWLLKQWNLSPGIWNSSSWWGRRAGSGFCSTTRLAPPPPVTRVTSCSIYSAEVRCYPLTVSCADTPRVRRPLSRYAHAVHPVNGLVGIGSIYQFNVFHYIYCRCYAMGDIKVMTVMIERYVGAGGHFPCRTILTLLHYTSSAHLNNNE